MRGREGGAAVAVPSSKRGLCCTEQQRGILLDQGGKSFPHHWLPGELLRCLIVTLKEFLWLLDWHHQVTAGLE